MLSLNITLISYHFYAFIFYFTVWYILIGGVMDRVVSQLMAEMDDLGQAGLIFVIGKQNTLRQP